MGLLKGVVDQITLPATAELDVGGEKLLKVNFEVTLHQAPYDEAQDVLRALREQGDGGELTDEALVRRYLRGWKMPGPDDVPVPFAEAALAEALQNRGYREALVTAVMKMLIGRQAVEAARRKN